MFDPRQLPTLDLNIEKFTGIYFQYPSPTLLDEWLMCECVCDECVCIEMCEEGQL